MGCKCSKLCCSCCCDDDSDIEEKYRPTEYYDTEIPPIYFDGPNKTKTLEQNNIAFVDETEEDYTREVNRYYSQQVQLSRNDADRSMEIAESAIEKILSYVHNEDELFSEDYIKVGSAWQNLKVNRYNEFDVNVAVDISGNLTWKNRNVWRYYDIDRRDWSQLQESPEPLPSLDPGYFVLEYSGSALDKNEDDLVFRPSRSDSDHLIPRFVKLLLKKHIKKALESMYWWDSDKWKVTNNGPAVKVWMRPERDHHGIMIDFTPKVHVPKLMGKWTGWPRKSAQWPSEEKIQEIKNLGSNFVAKDPLAWYVSFAQCEMELITGIDRDGGCRKKVYRMMKKLTIDAWCNEPKHRTKAIPSSYVLKNILFWECETFSNNEDWVSNMIWIRLKSMTERLLTALQSQYLAQYFYQKINLLKDVDQEKLVRVTERIKEFLRDPLQDIQTEE